MKEEVLLRTYAAIENAYYNHCAEGSLMHSILFIILRSYEKYLVKNHFDMVVEHIPWIDSIAWRIWQNHEEERVVSNFQS